MLWLDSKSLILASRSRARLGILQAVGIPVQVQPSDVDERALESQIEPGAAPGKTAFFLARSKALQMSQAFPERWVLGCDQILEFEGRVLHKAPDRDSLRRRLLTLAGREHRLHSAAVLARSGEQKASALDDARIDFRDFGSMFIDCYLESAGDAALECAGGYEAEGLGLHLIRSIHGDHATVLGLPLLSLLESFGSLGLIVR